MTDERQYMLRPLEPKDAAGMTEWMHDDDTTKYLQIGDKAYTMEDALHFIEAAKDEMFHIHRAIVDTNDVYMGTVSLKSIDREKGEAEYAIVLHPEAQGRGVAYSATENIMAVAFKELGLKRVYLNVLEENQRARHFYEKFGFIYKKKTVSNIKGELRTLLWYEKENPVAVSNESLTAVSQKKLVFFIQKRQAVGGGILLFWRWAQFIIGQHKYDKVYFVNYKNANMDKMFSEGDDCFRDIETVDFSEFEGADFVVPLNYVFFLLEKTATLKYGRILLYDWHPHIVRWYVNQFYYRRRNPEATFSLFCKKNAVAFMDEGCVQSFRKWVKDIDTESLPYVPVTLSSEKEEYIPLKRVAPNKINIGWMGRLDKDKIFSLINLLDNLVKLKTEEPIDIHIIGDGNARNRIVFQKYAPKIRFIFTSTLYGAVRDQYIRENIDIMIAMGISALDTANLSVPIVVPIVSGRPFYKDQFVFLFDSKNYSLSWDSQDIDELGYQTHTLAEILSLVYLDGGKERLGKQCWAHCQSNFAIEKSVHMLLDAISKSELSLADCRAIPEISRQMQRCGVYTKIRRGRTYEEYIEFNQRLNRLQGKSALGKLLGVGKICLSPVIKPCVKLQKKIRTKLSARKKRTENLKRYRQVQENYSAKIELLQQTYKEQRKLKAIFLVIFGSVFPTEPIFARMLQDEQFDPYIMVIPDMQRSSAHLRKTYTSTYEELRQKYGDRVIHGFDLEADAAIEPGDSYQLAFFNNPYSRMAHRYHHVTYFLNKNVLTFYADYGFVALKYARNIMGTDFYNLIWKVCLDSDLDYIDVKKYAPLQGENTVVTGYLKMDRLRDVPVYQRDRKRIIISPHHTVLGWKSLDISNFLTYSEFFIELPKKYPQIDFVFRPHPLLFSNLVENYIWTQDEVDNYLARMLENSNIKYDASGDYFELFANSDGIIHDCGSFIGEYLFTEKPCCYMLKSKKEIKKICSSMGLKCMQQYYKAFSEVDILKFLDDVIINGIDPLKKSREEFSREVLKFNYPYATDKVLQLIKATLCS